MLLVLLALTAAQPPASSPTPPRSMQPFVRHSDPLNSPPTGADPAIQLPAPENLLPVQPDTIRPEATAGGWVVRLGPAAVREFGTDQQAASDLTAAVRKMRVNQWGTIGSPRPVVEYGLFNGIAPPYQPTGRSAATIDLATLRAEPARGVWLVRDDAAILLNFGPDRAGAEQAAAVARKYGFNRVGHIGSPQPTVAYYYADRTPLPTARGVVPAEFQEQSLTRTGVQVAGGFVGDRQVIDARKFEVRKDHGEWVLAQGPDVFARFGQSDWTARDALKVARDCRFTEFCRVGGLTFFLVNGAAPTRVPFNVKGTTFTAADLTVRPADGKWAVGERTGRSLFTAATEADAKQIVQVITAYKFDTVCRVGLGSRDGLQFLAKTGGR